MKPQAHDAAPGLFPARCGSGQVERQGPARAPRRRAQAAARPPAATLAHGDGCVAELFDTPMAQLVQDAQGGIRYWPSFLDPATAQAWFISLLDGAAWTALRRPMYDRVVDVPRLLAAYRVPDFPPALPLAQMLARVQGVVPAPYNAVGMNLYRDGNDSVAMHSDKLHSLVTGHPITLVSLGAPRRMLIRAKTGARETVAVELAPGSLLRMSHAAQLTHEHGIPKTKRSVGPRMSVVFRVRPQAASPYGGMRPG